MTDEELEVALSVLKRGDVVAAATETFFGFLSDARRADALDRLFDLKGRAFEKGVALLLPERGAWRPLVLEIPAVAERLADRFWPGPLTIALAARRELDPRITVDGTVAARWAGPSAAARITGAFGAPLTATSANRAGEAPGATGEEVRRAFTEPIARGELWVVSGAAPGGEPSTVVAVVGQTVRVVRSGRIRESNLAPWLDTS